MKTAHINYITNLRVLATILVITLHLCADYVFNYKNKSFQWELINALDSVTRICIGLFFMIIGAVLVRKNIDLKSFLKDRFTRILYPFIFWSAVYILFVYCQGEKSLENIVWHSIYFGAYYHFWFVYILIGIYLLLPIISVFLLYGNKGSIQYFLVIWTIWLFANMYMFQDILPNINLTYFSGYIGYVVLGYYYHYVIKKTANYRILLAIVVGYLITVVGTTVASSKSDYLETIFYQYLDANVALLTAGVFLLFKQFVTKTNNFVKLISQYSYGIYFIHPLFIYAFIHFNIVFSWIWIVDVLIKTVLVTLLSLASIYMLNKLPKGKLYIG